MKPALRRVLVVDDVVDNVGVLFEFLREAGFRVLVSESARHAIAELPRMAPDIILLDVMMPEMDGFEACRRIKAMAEFADVPILFMTALSDPVDKVRGLQAGAADYITKPLFPEEVLARINVHLELRERNRQLAEQNERLDAAIQQRIAAERTLSRSLDRAVFVAPPPAIPPLWPRPRRSCCGATTPFFWEPSFPGRSRNGSPPAAASH